MVLPGHVANLFVHPEDAADLYAGVAATLDNGAPVDMASLPHSGHRAQ